METLARSEALVSTSSVGETVARKPKVGEVDRIEPELNFIFGSIWETTGDLSESKSLIPTDILQPDEAKPETIPKIRRKKRPPITGSIGGLAARLKST